MLAPTPRAVKVPRRSGSNRTTMRLPFTAPRGQSAAAPLAPATPVAVSGSGFAVGELRDGERAFGNRDCVWRDVSAALVGWRIVRVDGGNTDAVSLTVRAERGGDLYAAATTPPDPGWEPVPGLALTYDDRCWSTTAASGARSRCSPPGRGPAASGR